MSFHLRDAGPGDADALAVVGQATFLETFAGVLDGAAVVAHCRDAHAPGIYAAYLARPDAAAALAEVEPGGAPVGYSLLAAPDLPVPDPRPTDVELKRIYVLGRYHGAGVGASLLAHALATARAGARTRVLLGVYAENVRARRFYARHGFAQVGERRFRVGPRAYDDVVLARDL